jgi:hypothetical protein
VAEGQGLDLQRWLDKPGLGRKVIEIGFFTDWDQTMSKKQALLFELMKDEGQPPVEKGFWGQLFRKKGPAVPEAEAASAPVSVRAAAQESQPEPVSLGVEVPPAAVVPGPASVGSRESEYEEPGEMQLYLRVNTFTKVMGITVILVIFFCGYVLGSHFGFRAAQEKRSDKQLGEISGQNPDESVLKVGPEGQSAKKLTAQSGGEITGSAAGEKDILKKERKITRKNGLNYLIIHVSKDLSEVERAMEFLATKGIETSIERVKSSEKKKTLYVLVSVAGFNLNDAKGKQDSLAFLEQTKAFGAKYRTTKGSNGLDFKTCYYWLWPLVK